VGYREIEDIGRIRKLGTKLNEKLRDHYARSEVRRIGYPNGSEHTEVLFLEDKAADALWYVRWHVQKHDKMVLLLGHGGFGSNESLSIDVQFNFPVEEYHRRFGGVFLEDAATGEVFLAHRGILTLRHRVPKDKVLEAMAADVVEARSSRRVDEYILVSPLESQILVENLSDFSRRLRSTIRNLGVEPDVAAGAEEAAEATSEDDNIPEDTAAPAAGPVPQKGRGGLRAYFEEFSGARRAFTPKKAFPVSYHGKVVHALHEEMARRGETLKSRAVDLVADLHREAVLFEVKTKADSQSVYAAIGQLAVHAPSVTRILQKPVRKVLVVPDFPMNTLRHVIQNDLGIQIVTYAISARGRVTLFGLEEVCASPKLRRVRG